MTRTETVEFCRRHGIVLEVHSLSMQRGDYDHDTHM